MNACIHFFCFKNSSHKQRNWYQISYFVEEPSDYGTHNRVFITLSFFGRTVLLQDLHCVLKAI